MQTETYWGMTLNPFTKELDVKDIFESEDMRQMSQRLEHLRNYPGIGLFTAPSGYGKSLALRKFTARLNPNLYKVVYTPFTSISESDFFRIVCLPPRCQHLKHQRAHDAAVQGSEDHADSHY